VITDKTHRGVKAGIWLPVDMMETLQASAQAADRTISAEVRRAVRLYLASTDSDSGGAGPGQGDPALKTAADAHGSARRAPR
jgi:hypothetical protein